MKNILILNAHEYYSFSQGKLNGSLVEIARSTLTANGYSVQKTTMTDDYDVDTELEKHRTADAVIVQSPVNWMGMPWSFKKYMDLVYTAGTDGRLCNGDGRTRKAPARQYGSGGTMTGKKYLLSLTFNAPADAFGDPAQKFFEGKSVDDLFWPMHLNFRFFGMEPLPTFSCHDVVKNPEILNDLSRYEAHIRTHFPAIRP
ncbi:NAD(P)H-dependent oxidoreductase [Oleidesulfovibrio alaskensis]